MFQVRNESDKNIAYAGRSKAVVIDTRDPLKRGRIRVNHPLLAETVWIDYLGDPHKFDPPKIGDIVYLEAEAGWYTYPVAHGRMIKGEDNSPDIPEEFRRDVPTNRGIYSPGGHLVEIDDGIAPATQNPQDTNFTTENRGVRITSAGNNKIHIIEDVDNGNTFILLQDAGGNFVKLDYKNNQLTINSIGTTQFDTVENRNDTVGGNLEISVSGNTLISSGPSIVLTDSNGNSTTLNSSGIIIEDSNGNKKTMSASGIELVDANGNKITMSSSEININSSSNSIKIDGSEYGSHTHLGNLGAPTGPPQDANTE